MYPFLLLLNTHWVGLPCVRRYGIMHFGMLTTKTGTTTAQYALGVIKQSCAESFFSKNIQLSCIHLVFYESVLCCRIPRFLFSPFFLFSFPSFSPSIHLSLGQSVKAASPAADDYRSLVCDEKGSEREPEK